MIRKFILASLLSSVLTAGMATLALAGGGGEGGRGNEGPSFIMTNPDGSTVEARRTGNGGRKITRRNAKGKVVKVRRKAKKGRSWAYNETTGTGSYEVVPGRYVPRADPGRPANRHVGGVRLVISPFGMGLSF